MNEPDEDTALSSFETAYQQRDYLATPRDFSGPPNEGLNGHAPDAGPRVVLVPSTDPVLAALGLAPPPEPSKVSSAQAAKHSSVKNEHYTPQWLIESCREVLEWFDLDPASDAFGNQRIGATRFLSKDDNSLDQETPWDGRVFLNPPGGRVPGSTMSLPGLFWRKLMDSHARFAINATLYPRREPVGVGAFCWIGFTVEQLAVLQKYASLSPLDFSVCVFKERIAFDTCEGESQDQPTHANFVCYAGTRQPVFEGVFSKYGKVVCR
jgi:hypothetical protein